jgi:DNA-binding NtrC family response regulator
MVTILVIDDDRHMRIACSRVLSRAGWSVICAETGQEGLNALQSGEHKIDVILVDQLMPGLNGMEVLTRIHAIAPSLPVILMTGSATEADAREIKQQGAFDCLAKPFTPEQLRNVILNATAKIS